MIWSACIYIIFLSFQVLFCSFAPLLTPKIKIWKKCIKKKTPGDIILLHMWPLIKIIWYMVPEIWSSTDRIFLSSLAIFCPFIPLTPQKMKTSKMKKTPGYIIILDNCSKRYDHPLYCSRDMVHDECNCYFHFGLYFSILPLPLYQPKK